MEFNLFLIFNKFTSNPYEKLSGDMILYRSCYPMKFNNFGMKCSKNNISLNIRIYDMKVADFCANRISANYTWDNRDVWREVAFMNLLEKKLIKTKICPHFPILIAYYLCDNNKINFENLDNYKKNDTRKIKKILEEKKDERELKQELMNELDKIRNKKSPDKLPNIRDKDNNIFYIGSYIVDTSKNVENIGYITDIVKDKDDDTKYIYIVKLINAAILADIKEYNDFDSREKM